MLLLPFTFTFALAAEHTVAVLPFTMGAGDPALEGLGTGLAGMVVSDLSRVESLRLVERQKLAALLQEIDLGTTGFVAQESVQKLGRGVGAEYLVTGSFSSVDGTFLIDARMFSVETGDVVKASSVEGTRVDFVAAEKALVADLLDGLEVQLSLADQRKLMIAAPTEKVEALADYGQGIEAEDNEELEDARGHFGDAVAKDPSFSEATTRLRALEKRVGSARDALKAEKEAVKAAAIATALETIPPAADHRGPWTREDILDQAFRIDLLATTEQWCQMHSEQVAFLEQTGGQWDRLTAGLDPDPDRAYRLLQRVIALRADELGLAGPPGTSQKAYYGTRMRMRLDSASIMLLGQSYDAFRSSSFTDTVGYTLRCCVTPEEVQPRWEALRSWADANGVGAQPSWQKHDGPNRLTVSEAMTVGLAAHRARELGIEPVGQALLDGVMAEHPSGSPGHQDALSAASAVVHAAREH